MADIDRNDLESSGVDDRHGVREEIGDVHGGPVRGDRQAAGSVADRCAAVDEADDAVDAAHTVVVKVGTNVLTGTRLVVDLSTGRARLEGNTVRGVFTPSQ